MSASIPLFYRVCFTVLDPMLAGFGIYANIFDPATILTGFTPKPRMPPAPETRVLLSAMAGFFAMLVFLQTVLLRLKPNDTTVWRCVQAGILFQDVFMIAAFLAEMQETGRLDTRLWSGNDWANMTIYPLLVVLRSSFIFNFLGLSGWSEEKAKKNSSSHLKRA